MKCFDFRGANARALGSLAVVASAGAFYGTTRSGGTDRNCGYGGPGGVTGCGTVFKLTGARW